MTQWQVISADRRVTHCPVALELRDEFTGQGAFGDIDLRLELQSGAEWIKTDLLPTRNSCGVFVYTGLGRALDPAAMPQFRVRIFIEAEYYRPAYRSTDDAIEFDVPTYNDAVPPAMSPLVPDTVLLLPTANYRFGTHIRAIRGRVLDPGGNPLSDAIVEADGVERVITGSNGAYTLPLRWQLPTANVNVAVDHPRSGQSDAQVLSLPAALTGNHDITVT